MRHRLIDPQKRRRRRSGHERWERARAMELWQIDITGGVYLPHGRMASVVTGIDDYSRFCVSAPMVIKSHGQASVRRAGRCDDRSRHRQPVKAQVRYLAFIHVCGQLDVLTRVVRSDRVGQDAALDRAGQIGSTVPAAVGGLASWRPSTRQTRPVRTRSPPPGSTP